MSELIDSSQNQEAVPFENFLRRDIRTLRFFGLHSMDAILTGKTQKTTIWQKLLFEVPMINLFLILLCEIYNIVDIWGKDLEYIVAISASMVAGGLCFCKGWRLWFSREELYSLLHRFSIMWKEVDDRVIIRDESLKMAATTCQVGKLYIMMVVILSLSYAFRPYAILLNQYVHKKHTNESYDYTATVYEAKYPWAIDTLLKYVMCITWEQYVIVYIILYWFGADNMFAQLTTHAAIQFRILWHDLEHVANFSDEHDVKNEKISIDRLLMIAKRHRDLYKYCESIQKIYNPLLFLTLLFTAANLCFCSFHLQKELLRGNWEEVIKMLLLVVTVAVQDFIYCGYSEKLTEQTNMVAQAAYGCQWVERGPKFKVLLQIIMIRAREPFVCTAYGFFFVNLSQMSAIFRTAGSYFTLLQSLT